MLSHVTQHSSHRNRKPQKQTVHPLSYPSTLHFPKYHLLLRNILPYFSPLPTAKNAFPHPPVIAYKRNASLRDLLVHSELPENKPSDQQPTGIHKCNHPLYVTSLAHFSKKAKPLTLFSPPKKHVKLLTAYLAIPKISST